MPPADAVGLRSTPVEVENQWGAYARKKAAPRASTPDEEDTSRGAPRREARFAGSCSFVAAFRRASSRGQGSARLGRSAARMALAVAPERVRIGRTKSPGRSAGPNAGSGVRGSRNQSDANDLQGRFHCSNRLSYLRSWRSIGVEPMTHGVLPFVAEQSSRPGTQRPDAPRRLHGSP